MNNAMLVHLFAEDRAHEEFVKAVLQRLGREAGIEIDLRPQSVRGGHGRTLSEFKEYQKALTEQGVGLAMPDLVVVVIDTNCRKHAAAHREIADAVERDFQSRVAIACPDPHVELWYMADPDAIKKAMALCLFLEGASVRGITTSNCSCVRYGAPAFLRLLPASSSRKR